MRADLPVPPLAPEEAEQVEIQCRYAPYIERQSEEIARLRELVDLGVPAGFDYEAVVGLRSELKEKLSQQRPATLGAAARIPGVTPAAVALLASRIRRLTLSVSA